jgi:hypothetical protein
MPWKTEEDGRLAVTEKGNPIWDADGTERECDYPAMSRKLQDNAKEATARKERIRALEALTAPLKDAGIDDLAAFLKEAEEFKSKAAALEGAAGKEDGDRAASIRAELEKSYLAKENGLKTQLGEYRAKLEAAEKSAAELRDTYHGEKLRRMFQDSAYARDKCNASPGILYALFRDRCGFDESGAFEGRDSEGNRFYGPEGAVGKFDEWLPEAVKAHPDANAYLLKGAAASGAGGAPSSGNGRTVNPFRKETYNVTRQQTLAAEDPELAKSLAKEAGLDLPGI